MKFVDELTSEKADSHHEGTKLRGVKRMKVYLQTEPSEQIVIYLESDDIGRSLSQPHSTDFDHWWRDTIRELTGHPSNFHGGNPPAQLLFDWHETHGHSKAREHAHA